MKFPPHTTHLHNVSANGINGETMSFVKKLQTTTSELSSFVLEVKGFMNMMDTVCTNNQLVVVSDEVKVMKFRLTWQVCIKDSRLSK